MANKNANKIEFLKDVNEKVKNYYNIANNSTLADDILKLICSNPSKYQLESKLRNHFLSHTQEFIKWLLDHLQTKFNLQLNEPKEILMYFEKSNDNDLNGEVNNFLDFLDGKYVEIDNSVDLNEDELLEEETQPEPLYSNKLQRVSTRTFAEDTDAQKLETNKGLLNGTRSLLNEKHLETTNFCICVDEDDENSSSCFSNDSLPYFPNDSENINAEDKSLQPAPSEAEEVQNEEQKKLEKILFDQSYFSYIPRTSPPCTLTPQRDVQISLKRKSSSLTEYSELVIPPARKTRFTEEDVISNESDASIDEETVQKSMKCTHWPNCKFGNKCLFSHPKMCKNLPNCPFGRNCWFTHPKASILVKQQKCRYFPGCTRKNCKFQHPKGCQFGLNCPEKNECQLYHPGDINFDQKIS